MIARLTVTPLRRTASTSPRTASTSPRTASASSRSASSSPRWRRDGCEGRARPPLGRERLGEGAACGEGGRTRSETLPRQHIAGRGGRLEVRGRVSRPGGDAEWSAAHGSGSAGTQGVEGVVGARSEPPPAQHNAGAGGRLERGIPVPRSWAAVRGDRGLDGMGRAGATLVGRSIRPDRRVACVEPPSPPSPSRSPRPPRRLQSPRVGRRHRPRRPRPPSSTTAP